MMLVVAGPATISVWYKSKPSDMYEIGDEQINIQIDNTSDVQRIVIT